MRSTPPPTTAEDTEREELQSLLVETIRSLHARIQAQDDFPDADAERLQLERIRTLTQATNTYRLLARDADVHEMEEELDLVTDVLEGRRSTR